MHGRHKTEKKKGNISFSKQWSGVTYAPECQYGECLDCAKCLHHEGGSHYCPYCDDYKLKPYCVY